MNKIACEVQVCSLRLSLPLHLYDILRKYIELKELNEITDIDVKVIKKRKSYHVITNTESVLGMSKEEVFGCILEEIEKKIIKNSEEVILHCSAIKKNNDVIIFCGQRGAGKSTALLNMLKKGYDFFADDFVYLKARKIKAIDLPIKSRKTRINSLKVKLVDEFKYILPKPEQAFDSNNYYDLKTIVFPIYDPEGKISFEKVTGVDFFNKIIRNCKKTISMTTIYRELMDLVNVHAYIIQYANNNEFYQCMEQILVDANKHENIS